jgi:hypothetical protein
MTASGKALARSAADEEAVLGGRWFRHPSVIAHRPAK